MNREKIEKKIAAFFFTPASWGPLLALRTGLAAVLLLQAGLVGPAVLELYGRGGWLQGTLGDLLGSSDLWGFSQLAQVLSPLGISADTLVLVTAILYVMGLLMLLVGLKVRLSGALVWLTHLFLTGAQITSYGVDEFANIFLFYLMIAGTGCRPSVRAGFWLRVMQLHLAFAYLMSGLDKAMGIQWWNGEAIWRTLMIPFYCGIDFSWLAQVPWLAKCLGWGTLLLEIGYPFFMWWPRTRRVWIPSIVALHLGIALFMGLGTFALTMIVLTVCLFGVSPRKGLAGLNSSWGAVWAGAAEEMAFRREPRLGGTGRRPGAYGDSAKGSPT